MTCRGAQVIYVIEREKVSKYRATEVNMTRLKSGGYVVPGQIASLGSDLDTLGSESDRCGRGRKVEE